MNKITSNRDSSVEFLRIIACIIVIGVHVKLGNAIGDGIFDSSRTYISCVLADGVAIFWLITGFFLFNNNSYVKVMSKTLRKTVIPLLIITFFMFYFGRFLINGMSLSESISHSQEDYISFFGSLIELRNPVAGLEHLWYLYVYILVMIIFPVLKSFVDYLDADLKRQKIFIIISFSLIILNDATRNILFGFSHAPVGGMIPASIIIIWGHILFMHKEKILKICKNPFIWLLIFFGINCLRSLIQGYEYNSSGSEFILYWYTSTGIACSICLMFFAFSFIRYIKSKKFNNIVQKIGSYTFLIYLVHLPLAAIINRIGLNSFFTNALTNAFGQNIIFEILYTIIIIAITFIFSFIIAYIIKIIIKAFSYFTQK